MELPTGHRDWGGGGGTQCAQDLTGIATALGKTGTDVTHAVTDCKKFGLKCTLDVASAAAELAIIAKDIIGATRDCS